MFETLHFYIFFFLVPNIKAIPENLKESNNLFLNFFFAQEASQSSDSSTDGQHQIAPQDRWKQKKSDGWHLKTTAIKQSNVGWISGLFLFHWNESSERHSLFQGGDQVKVDASPLWQPPLDDLATLFIQFNCFLYSNFHRGCILFCFSFPWGRKKSFSFLHYPCLSSEKRQSSPGGERNPVRA